MKKIFTFVVALFAMASGSNVVAQTTVPTPVYLNTFEDGIGDGCTQVGNGSIVTDDDTNFGKVYFNDPDCSKAQRSNYLLLPSDLFAKVNNESTSAMSIAFWVNVGNAADYWFSPMFMAYGAAPANGQNNWPMLACQSRLLFQVNCAGWCDFAAEQNAAGANTETTVWLDDKAWHYYTATITPTTVCIYVDGTLQNQWNIDNTSEGQVVAGVLTNGAQLTYPCLGGNQAWNWADPDPSYKFDDFAMYASALTVDEIKAIMAAKTNGSTGINAVKASAESVNAPLYNLAGQRVSNDAKGLVIKNGKKVVVK